LVVTPKHNSQNHNLSTRNRIRRWQCNLDRRWKEHSRYSRRKRTTWAWQYDWCHLSELSTWEDTGQIDASLMPTMHRQPRLLAIFESTAKGRNNYWHNEWLTAMAGKSRFTPLFVPWYADKSQYRMRPPLDWTPSKTTTEHALHCERTGERWIKGKVELSRDQLYWYEFTRENYESKDMLSDFFEEYAADPESAFQFSGRSIFSTKVLERIQLGMRPVVAVLDVGPMREIQREKV